MRRCKRKEVPTCDRKPLLPPQQANEVWSMDFVFDRTAEGIGILLFRRGIRPSSDQYADDGTGI